MENTNKIIHEMIKPNTEKEIIILYKLSPESVMKQKEYKKNHPEVVKAYNQKYYLKNKERILEKRREKYKQNKDLEN